MFLAYVHGWYFHIAAIGIQRIVICQNISYYTSFKTQFL